MRRRKRRRRKRRRRKRRRRKRRTGGGGAETLGSRLESLVLQTPPAYVYIRVYRVNVLSLSPSLLSLCLSLYIHCALYLKHNVVLH